MLIAWSNYVLYTLILGWISPLVRFTGPLSKNPPSPFSELLDPRLIVTGAGVRVGRVSSSIFCLICFEISWNIKLFKLGNASYLKSILKKNINYYFFRFRFFVINIKFSIYMVWSETLVTCYNNVIYVSGLITLLNFR